MMTGQRLREALHAGTRVYGSCLINPSVAAIPRYAQLDFAFIDNEHTPLGRASTMALCQGYRAHGVAPIVRIPVADPILACMALDGGAEGIICPYMEDPDRLREMVGAVKYRPLKGIKLAAFLKDGTGVSAETRAYLEHRNRNCVLIINVESVPALDRLDALLAVSGLDGVLVGPHDLSVSLDIPEQYEAPEFIAAVERIIAKARAAGLGVGIHYWQSLERELHYVRKGANFIVHSSDVAEAAHAIDTALSSLRATLGDAPPTPAADAEVI